MQKKEVRFGREHRASYAPQRGTSCIEGEERRYLSYLLRLWQIKSGGELVWRMSLETPHTHERQGFASLEKLFDFLRKQTGVSSDSHQDRARS